MRLRHLGLPVRDHQRSLTFYARWFGFDPATATTYPDGTVIVRDADGFDLALHAVAEVGPAPDFLHFGFALPSGDAVRDLHRRLLAEGVPVIEFDEEPELVSLKCLDPDGWRVEVYWEP